MSNQPLWVQIIGLALTRVVLWCLGLMEQLGISPDLEGERNRAKEKKSAAKEFHPFAWLVGRITGNRVLYAQAIELYRNPSANLNGPVNDLQLVAKRASERGYSIRWLKNEQATRIEILAHLRAAVAEAKRGKRVRYWASGHGTRIRDRNGDEADGWDGGIVGYDMQAALDDEVGSILSTLSSKDDFALILDICHAGEQPRAFSPGQSVRGLPEHLVDFGPARAALRGAARGTAKSVESAGVLAACRDVEYSMESRLGSKVYGAFTYFALVTYSGTRSLSAVRSAAEKALRANGFGQTPVVSGNGSLPLL